MLESLEIRRIIWHVKQAFVKTSFMDKLWTPVMCHLMSSPETGFTKQLWWISWVQDLIEITKLLPDLLVRIRSSPVEILDDLEWERARNKVAFLDMIIDYAYIYKWGDFREERKSIHLGRNANINLAKEKIYTSPGPRFEFREEENLALKTLNDLLNSKPSDNQVGQVCVPAIIHLSMYSFLV